MNPRLLTVIALLTCLIAFPTQAGDWKPGKGPKHRIGKGPPPFVQHPHSPTPQKAIEIDQESALAGGVTPSDTPGWPVTIDRPGLYRLTGNLLLTRSDSNPAIEIIASSVSLDLGGFEIHCDHCEASHPVEEQAAELVAAESQSG